MKQVLIGPAMLEMCSSYGVHGHCMFRVAVFAPTYVVVSGIRPSRKSRQPAGIVDAVAQRHLRRIPRSPFA